MLSVIWLHTPIYRNDTVNPDWNIYFERSVIDTSLGHQIKTYLFPFWWGKDHNQINPIEEHHSEHNFAAKAANILKSSFSYPFPRPNTSTFNVRWCGCSLWKWQFSVSKPNICVIDYISESMMKYWHVNKHAIKIWPPYFPYKDGSVIRVLRIHPSNLIYKVRCARGI